MNQVLQSFIWLPLLGFIFSVLSPQRKEKLISGIAIWTSGIQLTGILLFTLYWLFNKFPYLTKKHLTIFQSEDIEIFIDYFFDKSTAVFAILGAAILFLISHFSKYYLHREAGFKRFFNAIQLFFLGYNIAIFSGNFETLFTGWELLGISSFLLITFYRDRYLPVKNGLKVISIYRLSDICLILAMWMSHHLWHENITFIELSDAKLVADHLYEHQWYAVFISLMIVFAAMIKSAQFPFTSWLPRAMEGPTSSSAIFYGALSVHLGVFLLLRTFPYWESLVIVKTIVLSVGAITWIISLLISQVQSSVKTQIAYSSASQIGLIFIEIALGFHELALLHFAANALFRTYQLLVSPSVLGYQIHDMVFNFKPKDKSSNLSYLTKSRNSLYILSIKEWNLDNLQQRFLWNPFKWIGKRVFFLANRFSMIAIFILYALGSYCDLYPERLPQQIFDLLPFASASIGLLLILGAFSERGDAMWAWSFVILGQLFIALSIALLNENFGNNHIALYLSGTILSALVGYACLQKIQAIDNDIDLNKFHGYTQQHPNIGFVFLICCLGMIGLPFTPTFIGIDILFSHIHKHQEILIILTALSFAFMELAILRIYSRIFLGPSKSNSSALAYRSA